MSRSPRLTICVGGGGVGKTTTSSALALAMARQGQNTLVITVDPARRLADALGVDVGQATTVTRFDERAGERLFAKMPDPRSSMADFTTWLFEDPAQRQRFQQNPAYRELADSLAGVHELLTIGLLQTEIDSGAFDEVVLDTAPSRHALAFLTYPSRLLELLEAKALAWLSALSTTGGDERRGFFAWGRQKVEGVFGKIIGVSGVMNLSAMFAELVSVRGRWADLARRTDGMLRDARTRYLVIGAPTGAALADIEYLLGALDRRKLRPSAVVLNRAEREASPAVSGTTALLASHPGIVSSDDEARIRQALTGLESEHRARAIAADDAERRLLSRLPRGTPLVRLPYVGPRPPQDIVRVLADAWEHVKI